MKEGTKPSQREETKDNDYTGTGYRQAMKERDPPARSLNPWDTLLEGAGLLGACCSGQWPLVMVSVPGAAQDRAPVMITLP